MPALGSARWRGTLLVLAVLAGAAGGALWWRARDPGAGTPRLVADRDVVDLGRLRYGTRARAVFTLTNAGTAPLRLTEEPRVTLVQGC